jgi:hypothetical protein
VNKSHNKRKEGEKMSATEVLQLKQEFNKITYKQLMKLNFKLNFERNHDVSEERYIIRRIPVCY